MKPLWIYAGRNLLALLGGVIVCTACVVATARVMAADSVLDLSVPVAITCETSAVKLDANPFKATKGDIVLELNIDDPADTKGPGRWKVIDSPTEHTVSFANSTRESCAPDCPFTQGKDGTLLLWSPKPLALTQLDETTALILVTINSATLELKASSFRKKELAGLERGDCRIVDSAVKSPDQSDDAAPATKSEPSPDTPSSEPSEETSEPATPPRATDKKQ